MVAKIAGPKLKGGGLKVAGLEDVVVDPAVKTSFTVTLGSTSDAQEVVGAFCQQYRYAPQVPNPEPQGTVEDAQGNEIPDPAWTAMVENPVDPQSFAVEKVVEYIHAVVQGYRAAAAQAAAAASVAGQTPPDVTVS